MRPVPPILPDFPFQPAVSGFLPNRLKYILSSDASNPVLCLQLYIRVGSAWETEREAGYSHFMEHLAFKSTRDFGYNQITSFVNGLGGSINAYTDYDCTCYYLLLPAEYLAEGLKVLSELAMHPTFTAEDLAMEKDIIIEEMEQNRNDPEIDFLDFIQASAFKRNPLRLPVMGRAASLKKAHLADLKAFHRKYYQPANSFLVVVGDFDRSTAEQALGECFGSWQNTASLPRTYDGSFSEPETPDQPVVWREHKQKFLTYVLPELCDTHPDSDSLLIALRYLAVGRPSRLFKRLVEEDKLASSVKVSSLSGVMSGVSAIVVSPMGKNNVDRIQSVFQQEYRALLEGNVDPGEISLVKRDIINTWRYGFDGVENLAGMLGAEEFISGYEELYKYDRQILSLGLEDVLKAVRKYWQPSSLQIIHQSPQSADLSLSVPIIKNSKKSPAKSKTSVAPAIPAPGRAKACLEQYSEDVFTATLANGLKFIYRWQPQRPICGFALSTDLCQLAEEPGQRGLNYLCSAAMLHSTQSRSYAEMLKTCRELGISLNVEPHPDTTVFRGKCFHSALPTALSMLAEIFWQPAFEENHIRLLKSTSIDLLRRDNQNPSSLAWLRWFRLLFGVNSPYGRYSGTISDLRSHGREAIRAWYRDYYRPDRFSLSIVSSVEPRKALDLAASLFEGECPAPPSPGFKAPLPQPSHVRLRTQKLDSGQAIIHLGGFAAPASDRTSTTAFHLLAQIIGGDMDSRLFNLVREKYGYAYQTGMEFSSTNELGYWFTYSYCDPDDRKPCLRLMREVLAAVCADGVGADELLHAQNYLCGMNRFEAESAALQAVLLSSLSALGYELGFYLNRERRIRSVDLETVNRVAQDWLRPDNQWAHILT